MPSDPLDPDSYLEDDPGRQYEEGNFDLEPPEPGPEIPDTSERYWDVDPEVRRHFWVLVLVFNVALFSISLGAMLLYFRGDLTWGGGTFVLGLVLGLMGIYRYRRVQRRLDAGQYDIGDDGGSTDDSTGNSERDETTGEGTG